MDCIGKFFLFDHRSDLLWSDPIPNEKADSTNYIHNEERDCSYYFGKKATKKFLDKNELMSVVRAH